MSLAGRLLVLAGLACVVALFFPHARVRAVAQLASGAVFVVSGLLTVALVASAFLLESQGGGVMLFVAVVPGLIAWISWRMFSASRQFSALRRRPVDEQRRQTLADFDSSLDEALTRLARLRAERDRFSTSAARRREIDRAIDHEQRMLGMLPSLRPALDDVRSYEQEEVTESTTVRQPYFASSPGRPGYRLAVICNQPSLVEYLIEQGDEVNAKNRLGWKPLMVAGGVQVPNAKKVDPKTAAVLPKALAARGLSDP